MKEKGILSISCIRYKDFYVFGIRGTGEIYNHFYKMFYDTFSGKYKRLYADGSFWNHIAFYKEEYADEFMSIPVVKENMYLYDEYIEENSKLS